MPEIAEVARLVHFLNLHLVGKTVAKVLAPDDSNVFGKAGTSGPAFVKALTGRKVVGAGRQGKYFWLLLDQPPHPVMHLGMTGWIHIRGQQTAYNRYEERSKGADKDEWPPRYWKFQLETETETDGHRGPQSKVEVAFTDARRFGRVRLVDCPGPEIRKRSPLVENGPDPVVDRDEFTEAYLRQKTQSRHVPVKALLLDQTFVSGIGNWVADEILYQARLHPAQYCDKLDDADTAALYRAARYVCDTAVEKLGNSDEFPADWLFEHRWGKGKKGAPATLPNGKRLTFITVGGRTSCVVPALQKMKTLGGAAAEDAEEVTEEEGSASKATESKFFDTKKTKDGKEKKSSHSEAAADEELRPAKKAKTSRAKGPLKEEQDDNLLTPNPEKIIKEKDGGKKTARAVPDLGRRRSARLKETG